MGKAQEAYTLSQAIQRHGRDFTVARVKLNEFKEPAGEELVGSFRGLFHVSTGFLDINLAEAGRVSSRKYPQMLLLYTEDVRKEDLVRLGGRTYVVTGVDDVGGLQLCTDLSLREV